MAEETKEKKPVGRPPKWNPEIADKILFLYSTSTLSLEKILAQLRKEDPENAPDRVTVWRWQDASEEFRNRFSRARELHADVIFEAAQDEAVTIREGSITTTGERGGKKVSETRTIDSVERSKLICSVYAKAAAHLNPRKYSEKLSVEGDSGHPIAIIIQDIGQPKVTEKSKKK